MTEKQPQHRGIGQTIAELIAHIDWKLSILPESVKAWGLGEDALTSLSSSLQRERELLGSLPQDITLKDAMDTYFKGQAGTTELFDSLFPDDHPHKRRDANDND